MFEFCFHVEAAEIVPRAAVPMLAFRLHIVTAADFSVHSIMLRCQIQIEAPRRQYGDREQQRLFELFGEPADWGRTLRNLPWTEANMCVPAFTGSTVIDLPITCTYDFNVSATKYFDALEQGDVPLCLLFSGTVFYADGGRPLQVGRIPWEQEAKFRLPTQLWRDMMDRYYPNCVWLPLSRSVFDQLRDVQRRQALPNWERALEVLLENKADVSAGVPAK